MMPGSLREADPAEELTAYNKRRSVMLGAAFVVVLAGLFCAVALLLGAGLAGFLAGLVLAVALAAGAYWCSEQLVLSLTGARPADPVQHARLHNMVEGLCAAAGLPKPRVFVVYDDALNAFATGRDPRHASVAVTTGLLSETSRIELEAVLAHELSHVKSHDILPSTLAVPMVGIPALALGPLGRRLMLLVVSPRRETLADVNAVALTRYPPGLIFALEKMRDGGTIVHSASRATAHLWIESPLGAGEGTDRRGSRRPVAARAVGANPPLEERIQALREL